MKISQKLTEFVFGNTYFHQTVTECVSNQYAQFDILTYQMSLQVMECPLILKRFFFIFSCLNCYISTKLSQIVSLINTQKGFFQTNLIGHLLSKIHPIKVIFLTPKISPISSISFRFYLLSVREMSGALKFLLPQ